MRRAARLALALPLLASVARAQIDPAERRLLQAGYYQATDGRAPLAGYLYFYVNQPNALGKGKTLRLALAPVYLDAELGFRRAIDPDTDFGVGLAGGGFADSYQEIRNGRWLRGESFVGHGVTGSFGAYHDFDLKGRVPLAGVLRGSLHHAEYFSDRGTEPGFQVPGSITEGILRTGMRWGGSEPVIFPKAAFELSGWYTGRLRAQPQKYGYNGDRQVEGDTHQLHGRTLFYWNPPQGKHRFQVMISGGRVFRTDRFSAFRLGGVLPMGSEFPLTIPGYYYQEVSARTFALFGGNYLVPLSEDQRAHGTITAATAMTHYAPGQAQRGRSHSGVGAGLTYLSRRGVYHWTAQYGYGINAQRSNGDGSHTVGILLQIDFKRSGAPILPSRPERGVDRALERIDRVLERGIDRLKPR